MVFPAPELVEPELVELLGEIEIASELEHRMLPDRMMGCDKGAEAHAGHKQVTIVRSGRDAQPRH